MAQFILDTSQLDQDVLGPVVFSTGSAELGGLTSAATALVENVVTTSENTLEQIEKMHVWKILFSCKNVF